MVERQAAIAADHPSLAGHFPGNPIVPGVVLLQEVVGLFESWRPDARLTGLSVVKFLAPLRPGQRFTIRFSESTAAQVRFECVRDDDQLLARGDLLLGGT